MAVFPSFLHSSAPGPVFAIPGLPHAAGLDEMAGPSPRLFAMGDWQGPTGTQHYRTAGAMLDMALARGDLAPGALVTEAAEPVFALAFAVAASQRGYRPRLFLPEGAPPALVARLEGAGAAVSLTPVRDGWPGAMKQAQAAAHSGKGFYLAHIVSDDEAEVHRRTTGPALYEALDRHIDLFVAGVGSGGPFSGTAEFLKSWLPDLRAVAVEPAESPVLSGGYPARHGITGLGLPFVPENFNAYVADQILPVSTGDALETAAAVLKTDGLPVGPAGGAVLAAALGLARRPENAGAVIAVLLDSLALCPGGG